MASIVSAGTTSATALNMSADTSGVLQLASNNGTVALTISTAQVVTFTNPPTATGGGSVATNTAYGTSALASNTSGTTSVAIGYQALQAQTSALNNTAVGYQAGYAATGGNNTFVGQGAGVGSTTATANTYIGRASGEDMTTGSKNTILGRFSGNQSSLDIRTASNYVVLSDGDGNPRGWFGPAGEFNVNVPGITAWRGQVSIESNSTSFYQLALNNTNTGGGGQIMMDFYRVGSRNGSISGDNTTVSYNTSSDYRLKENVQPMVNALSRVSALKPCTYSWKSDGSTGEGFIAHELAEVIPQAVHGEKDAVKEDNSIDPQGVDTSHLVAMLTAAIQELNAKVTSLEEQVLNLGVK
jgi:hypothetical protein